MLFVASTKYVHNTVLGESTHDYDRGEISTILTTSLSIPSNRSQQVDRPPPQPPINSVVKGVGREIGDKRPHPGGVRITNPP